MTEAGLHITSAETMEKLKTKKLSASLVTSMESCAASWLNNTFVMPNLPTPVDTAATRGTLFHSVMEEFYALPSQDRTSEKLRTVVKKVISKEDNEALVASPGVLDWLFSAISNYVSMSPDPRGVIIPTFKNKYGYDVSGLELFVSGKIADTNREILGFIDQVTQNEDGTFTVTDFKTGAKSKHYKKGSRYNEGFAEQRQQIIYSMLLQQMGHKVSAARLIYPVAKDIVNVNLHDKELILKVLDSVVSADKKLSAYEEENLFPFKPSVLCSWCPLAKMCPKALQPRSDKSVEARNSQPDPTEFDKYIGR